MGTCAKFVSRIELEPNLFEIKHEILDNGSCQCSKDCDCYKRKGSLLGIDIKYSNGLVMNPGGKERTYSSIRGCRDSFNSFKL